MELFLKEGIEILRNKHLAPEPHMRVQVLTVTPESSTENF